MGFVYLFIYFVVVEMQLLCFTAFSVISVVSVISEFSTWPIFSKSLSLLWDLFNRHFAFFFETSVLKEVRILRYLHNNSAVLILMLSYKIKLSYTIFIHTWKTFIADFFYDKIFYTLYFITVHTFLFNWVFLKNSKHFWKHVFI